jgi:UMF1 family MFS transporter
MDEPRKPRLLTRPDILAWAMYDWANSAFSTLSITIIVVFFSEIVFPKSVYGTWSGSAYAFALAAATLVAGLLSPIVGALADARFNKHSWLRVTALAGAACSLGLAISPTDSPWLPTALFMGALFFFELSYGFANAFLPDLATEEEMNRVSAFGFALGYIGGALALITAIALIKLGDSWGWTGEEKLRSGLAVMGAWWGIFSLPAIFLLKDRRHTEQAALENKNTLSAAIKAALGDVRRTLGDMRNYRMLALFLIGFLLYNDCVQTVISQASNFAREDLGFQADQLIMVVLMIQFVALPGSLFIGWLSDRIGQRRVLFICLASWAAILLSSWLIADKSDLGHDALAKTLDAAGIKLADVTAENVGELKLTEPQLTEVKTYLSNLAGSQRSFWIMGACVALVMGGIQSVSRAIMGKMTPPEKSAEFFGFFNLSSKATCFIGPAIFGSVYTITGKYKLAILSLLVQLILGAIVVTRVNIEQGRRDARGGSET